MPSPNHQQPQQQQQQQNNNQESSSAAMSSTEEDSSSCTATKDEAPSSSGGTPFRMEVKHQQAHHVRKRKRAIHHPPNAAVTMTTSMMMSEYNRSADPFGYGDDDDDDDDDEVGPKPLLQQQQARSASPSASHPPCSNSSDDSSFTTVKASNATAAAKQPLTRTTSPTSAAATTTTTTTTTTTILTNSNSSKREKVQQPDGWRVKLYRLNADGSWDDCGTGRVLCLYRPATAKANANSPMPLLSPSTAATTSKSSAISNTATTSAAAAAAGAGDPTETTDTTAAAEVPPQQQQHNAALDAWICQELGEPTLCMHAELLSDQTQPKILLRTRILLRDAYQRQGENIITWCEPYYDSNNIHKVNAAARKTDKQNGNHAGGGGVDLALSFQDNAGCLDIWRQITHVQRRAADLYRSHQQQQRQNGSGGDGEGQPQQPQQQLSQADGGDPDENQNTDNSTLVHSNSSNSSNNNIDVGSDAGTSVTDMARKIAQDHHAELDRQQQHEMWVSMAGAIQHPNHRAFGEGDDSQQQQLLLHHPPQHHVNLSQHNAVHHVHHHGRDPNNNNTLDGNPSNPNKQQQQPLHPGDPQQQQQQQQHVPFVSGDDGTTDLYGNGASSPSHLQEQALGNIPNNALMSPQLPNPPTLANLEEIADTIARVQHIQQRESLAMFISQNECSYLKSLLALFPTAEVRGDYGSLATLAACVKTVLLLNDPSILELIVSDEGIFEEVCATLEYDPDLRDKANHRWFLRERARFRTVVLMEDEELVSAIHRAFRVNYLRDTLLRPTMDESSLSTLSSLQTFTHADVVKGVTISPPPPHLRASSASSTEGHDHGHHDHDGKDVSAQDSYLVRVIRVLGLELHALCHMEWAELEARPAGSTNLPDTEEMPKDHSIVVSNRKYVSYSQTISATWQQHLAPQDGSLASRRIRRRGCLTFLRELFNMVRISLQQSDKDNFFSVIVSMEIEVMSGEDDEKGGKISDNESQTSKIVEVGSVAASEKSERFDEKGEGILSQHLGLDFMPLATPVNLLSLLGTVLSDPNTDVTEKGLVLEIIAGVAMHDPGLIRRHCLEFHSLWKRTQNHSHQDRDMAGLGRPEANEKKQVIFLCPPNDLLAALLFLLDAETDAGILLQVSEIMRIILDTDMMGEHGPMGVGFADEAEHGVFADEAEGIPPGTGGGIPPQPHEQHNQMNNVGSTATTTEQKQFLSMFYEHFIDWVVAPFQFTILHPFRRVPDRVLISPSESPLLMQMMKAFKDGVTHDDGLFRIIPRSAIRMSFAVELLSFCVRAHLYRMKIFLLKSRVLSNVLKLLKPHSPVHSTSGNRCLKLAALRFLRAILSVNDEFYHRHIIHHNLFSPVFEAFRANPVGDNLVSSAIVEMCDFIQNENIMSLMEYIVTKHLSVAHPASPGPSLEDVSSPYVNTLTTLRESYEQNLEAARRQHQQQGKGGPNPESPLPHNHPGSASYFSGKAVPQGPRVLSGKALEDQRKFREEHDEESYFEDDDDEGRPQQLPPSNTVVPPAVYEVAVQEGEGDMHRTARMFALAQPLMHRPIPPHRGEGNGVLVNHTGQETLPDQENAPQTNTIGRQEGKA